MQDGKMIEPSGSEDWCDGSQETKDSETKKREEL